MLGNINTNDTRANWCTVPGRRVNYTYNAAGKMTKETYLDVAGNTIFAVNYEYNEDGKPTTQYCTEN